MLSVPPRLLILAGYHPGSFGVGGMLLADVARAYPRDRLCCFAYSELRPVSHEFDDLPSAFGAGTPERIFSTSPIRLRRVLSLPWRWVSWRRQAAALVEQSVGFGRQQKVEMIWGVTDYLTNILMTRAVARRLDVPYSVTVWDPPEFLAYIRGLDRLTTRFVLKEFARLLRGAHACGVASPAMAAEYERRYGARCVVMYHGIPRDLWQPVRRSPGSPDRLVIAIAGTLYAKRVLRALLDALNSSDWRVGGRRVTLRVLGYDFAIETQRSMHVEFMGYRPLPETIRLLHESDIGYVPYWFDPAYQFVARLSFPGKLTACLAAGLPIFFHGPDYSSAADLVKRYSAGACCHSLAPAEILAGLESLAGDTARYGNAAMCGRAALERELNLDSYLSSMATLVDVPREALVK